MNDSFENGAEYALLRSSRVLSYGNKTYRLESFVDISRQKQLERQTKEEMERALKRTEEYAKKADEASRSKSRFLASMSHEIRTPINGVLGFLSLLKETEVSREQMDFLQNAENSARILLALSTEEQPRRGSGAETLPENAAEGENGKQKKSVTVLIAEDNVINQKLACKILEKQGYSFDVAADGREALDRFRRNSYDLILMDCLMPEMDGYVSTLKIRQCEKKTGARRTPIIALTANVMKGERQKVLSAGMDDYLTKPIEPKKLIETVEKWLAGR